MISTKIDFTRYDVAVRETQERLDKIIVEAAVEGAKRGVRYARTHHPHQNRTGNLVSPSNLYHEFLGIVNGAATAAIVAAASYARYIEYGAPAHWIFPRFAQFLVFEWHGQLVFSKGVFHPGIAKDKFKFLRPASVFAKEVTRRVAITGIRDLAREVWS